MWQKKQYTTLFLWILWFILWFLPNQSMCQVLSIYYKYEYLQNHAGILKWAHLSPSNIVVEMSQVVWVVWWKKKQYRVNQKWQLKIIIIILILALTVACNSSWCCTALNVLPMSLLLRIACRSHLCRSNNNWLCNNFTWPRRISTSSAGGSPKKYYRPLSQRWPNQALFCFNANKPF